MLGSGSAESEGLRTATFCIVVSYEKLDAFLYYVKFCSLLYSL